ncbi:MAG: peptidase M22 [Clostridiales bacterium]|nr:peptidase M22 [Clostridiales bacterium]
MSCFLGIDSSNYTSSAALYRTGEGILANCKQLLPVKTGELGLRQSDAVFHHVKNLPGMVEEAVRLGREACGKNFHLSGVGVSVRPRDAQGSYMPCFLAGQALARSAAAALGAPLYTFSHQAGHIAAALYSAGRMELINRTFLAFHVSGGTTEAVLTEPDEERTFRCTLVARSLDLKAGQAIDRVGGMLGLPFPAGPHLERLAGEGESPLGVKPTLRGADCCLSGLENQSRRLLEQGTRPADVARFALESVCAALDGMTAALRKEYGPLPLVFAGGVTANGLIRRRLTEKYGASFAQPAYSADNAAGIALLACLRRERTS